VTEENPRERQPKPENAEGSKTKAIHARLSR
jgi:hypothetical protein